MASSIEIAQNSLNSAIQTYFLAVEYFGANSPQAAASLANVNAVQKQLDETYQAMLAANRQAAEQEAARLLAERQAAVDKENARIAAEQEAARVAAQQEAARIAAQQEAARVEAARVAAQQEAARAEAARIAEAQRVEAQRAEAARVAAQVVQAPPSPPPEVTEGIANNLMYRSMTGGVPTSEFDKYGGYEAVRAKSTLAATPKAIGEYERAMGLPESEYTKVNKEYAASGKSKDTIVSEITALVPASGSITYESLVNYANNNNLPFQSVANALEGKFKDTTPQQIVDNLNFEDDRLALNRLATTKKVDGKDVTSVDLADAIKAASQGLVSPENLAKFFGKTPAEMASFVSSNLDYIADNLRDNGIDPSKSLNSMFGIAADKVTQSINKIDIQEGLNALAGTDGKISFDAALDYAKTKNLSNDELAGYLGVTPKAITDYVKDSGIRSGLNALADSSGNITYDAALDFADDKDMTIDELASYLGVKADTLNSYEENRQMHSAYVKDGYYGYDPEKLTPQQRSALNKFAAIQADDLASTAQEKGPYAASAYLLSVQRDLGLSDNDLIGFASRAIGVSPSDIQNIINNRDQYALVQDTERGEVRFIPKTALDEFAATNASYANLLANAPYGRDPVTGIPYTKEQRMDQVQMQSVRGDFFGKVQTDPKAAIKAVMDRIERNELSEGESAEALGMTMEQLAGYARYYAKTPAEYDQINRVFGKDEYGNWVGAQSTQAYPKPGPTTSGKTTQTQSTPTVDYKSPIYMQAFTQGIMKRTDLTDAQKATEINNYKNQYGVTNEQLAGATGYTVQQVNDFLSPKTTTPSVAQPSGAQTGAKPSIQSVANLEKLLPSWLDQNRQFQQNQYATKGNLYKTEEINRLIGLGYTPEEITQVFLNHVNSKANGVYTPTERESLEKRFAENIKVAQDVKSGLLHIDSLGNTYTATVWAEAGTSNEVVAQEYARHLGRGLTESQIKQLYEQRYGPVGATQWNEISTAGKAIAAKPVKTTAAPTTATTAAPTTESILNGLKAFADKDGKITFDAALEYANRNKVPLADVAKAINVTPEALTKYSTDKQISSGLQTAAGSDKQLSYDEILNYTAANNYKLEDIVKYIGTPDKQAGLLTGLKKYAADKPIIEGLQTAAGQDKQLSYSEIVDFASKNNMDLSNVVNYIGTEDKRSDLLTSLQNYVKEEGFKSSLSDTKLTDYKGNQYAANDLLKLADQVKQNFDTKNSSGGVYKTSGESVGFDYSEAKKLFPEGKNPTVFDQVALDIARGLLNAGIKDVSELGKYKPTEVTELDYNVEAGPPVEYKVTKLINPETGEEAPNLGATYTGKGGTVYNFTVDASGKPVFGTAFTDTSDKGQIATLVAFGAAILAPQILPQLIGAAPAAVAGVEGAVAQAALGGTGLTGSLMAAGIPASVAGYAATAIVNGVYNGLVSEVTGGDFEKGFITGGVAPVMGQLTANAVNSITTGLPAGVSSAVGNAVTQLISTGEIDLGQVALAGARPTVINTIVDASGGSLTAPQARLLLETVASGGKNITSLAQNPAGVVNFVLRNQDAFKNLSTAAATNTAQKPPAVDLSGLDTVQKEVLTSQPRTETIQGEALFQDINTTELGTDLAKTGIVRPPGEIISTDLSKPVTGVDEFARYDDAIKFAQALISGDPSALAKMAGTAGEDTGVGQLSNKDAIAQIREAQRTGALDYYNLSQAQLEAMLIDRAPTLEKAKEMAELAYGKGASFSYGGKFYEGSGTPLSQAVQIKDSSGKVFDVPANATLNKNSSGAVVGYTHNGTTYEYQNGKMVPLASTALPEKYTLEDVRKLSLDGLTKLYESIDPNAHKQTTIPGTGQVVTPYQAWLVRYGKNPEAAVAELNATAPVKDASVLQTISKNIGNVVQELRSSDNSYVRSVGDKLATNATYLGEAVKGAATTLSSPVELFNAIAFGDPINPISQWASGVRSDITAAQAAVDPGWQKTKSFINEQLTKIGADQGQIAQFVAGADLYANNPRALGDFFWSTVPTAIPGVAAYSALTRFGVPIAYAGGAFAAATGSQTDLVPMADATYQNLLEQVKRDNPNISERDAQERAAAGTAVSMRAAGLISLAGSTAIQLLPGTQAGGILAKAVTREIGQEIGDESWVKVLSNAWQGKDLQTDMGRTVLEAVLASGPISTAANLLTNQYGTTYNQDQVVKDLNWELENATPTFNQGVKVLTGPNNQPILNSANQPILLTYDQKPGLTFDEDPNKPGPSPTELNKSSPTESIFDVIFDNEQNGGYTVNSVSLDGNSYTITDKDGNTKVLNTNELLNNALNIVTQQDPGAYQSLASNNPLEALISDRIARTIDLGAINQNNQLGNIIATNQNGAFAITDSGSIAFVPNKLENVATKIDFKVGDPVVIGQGLALPVQKEVTAGGQVTFKPDSSLDLGVTFGPIFAEVQTNTGTALVNTTAPNVSTGTVVSIDPSTQTALVSTNTGNPFLVNLFGYNPNIGSNLFFNATTGDVIGAPLVKPPIGELGGLPPPVIEGGIMGPPPVFDINQPPGVRLSDVVTSQPVDTSFVNTSVNPPSTELPPVVAPPIIVDTVPPPPPPVVPPTITPPATDLPPTISPPTITPSGVGVPTVNVPTGSVPTPVKPVTLDPSIPIVKPPVIPTVITNPPIITTTTQPKPWDLPVVPPPDLSGSFQMPYPNYLRPLDPYLPYGIGALMGDLYDEVSRDGGYQPLQNAQGQIKIPA